MKSKTIADNEIEKWVERDPTFEQYFKIKKIKSLIDLCCLMADHHHYIEQGITDFVKGLALLRLFIETGHTGMGKLTEELTKPFFDKILDFTTSDHYRKFLIDQEITGKDLLNFGNGLSTYVTQDEILLHVKRTKSLPLNRKDIAGLLPNYKQYKMNQYGGEPLPPPVLNPTSQKIPRIPKFDVKYIDSVFDFLVVFFKEEDQERLYHLLQSCDDLNDPLVFMGNGNRLAHTFKILFENDIIIGCKKKELEEWIIKNFKYISKRGLKEYQPTYINDIISSTKPICKNPIIKVIKDSSTGLYKLTKT